VNKRDIFSQKGLIPKNHTLFILQKAELFNKAYTKMNIGCDQNIKGPQPCTQAYCKAKELQAHPTLWYILQRKVCC